MSRKFILSVRVVSIFLLIVMLVACAPDRPDGDQEENNTSDKPEELTIWANDQDEQLEVIEEIAEKYEEKEGIKVKVVAKSMLDQVQELSLAGPEGKGPDLFYQAHDQIGNIVAQGLAEPLKFTDEELAGYSQSAIDAVTYEYDGETDKYGVPAVFETYGVFYNKSIVDAPETIDDLKMILEDHTDREEDKYGFLMKPDDLYFAYPFLKNFDAYIFGGEVGEYDSTDIGLNTEGAVKGAELFQSFFGKDLIPPTTTVDVINGLFTEGKVGAVVNGPWSISEYTNALGDDLGFVPFPVINNAPGSTLMGVKSWMVSYYSEEKDWAKDLALFMTNEENLVRYFEVAGELPPNPKALEAIEGEIYSAFVEQIKHAVPMPSTPQMSQVWQPMNDALQFLAQGEDPKEVLDEAVEHIKTNLEASE